MNRDVLFTVVDFAIFFYLKSCSVCPFERYVAHGKGILQSHDLIDDLDSVVGEDGVRKLKDGPFIQILRCSQVIPCSEIKSYLSSKIYHFSLSLLQRFFSYGSSSIPQIIELGVILILVA